MSSYLNALGVICAAGQGKQNVARALLQGDCSGMQVASEWVENLPLTVGAVRVELPTISEALRHADRRNNRLLLAAAEEIETPIRSAIERYGAHRVAVVIGTSTSAIDEAEQDISRSMQTGILADRYDYRQQEIGAPAAFLSQWLGVSGPTYSLSTACTSSARALLSAHRLLQQNLCDAVVVGGVDTLCRLTLNGFHALEAISTERCNPFSRNRNGINIGEAAALFLMTREPGANLPALLGAGATSDAYHISAPDPQGLGAQRAMNKALQMADLQAQDIDYLNLHGTATHHNDAMESIAVQAIFPAQIPCSSSKPMTGHTLGAAGALEAALLWLTLQEEYNPQNLLPPHVWDGQNDPALPLLDLVEVGRSSDKPLRRLMSNSFAFGGNNLSLIIGEAP